MPSLRARCTACANAVSTVRIVPSRGSLRLSRAYSAPPSTPAAKSAGSIWFRWPTRSQRPRKNCARIAPELPRAPSSAASATRVSVLPACRSGHLRSAPSTAFTVSARFVPVSPSGTGNTLILFRCSWRDSSRRMPACSAKFSRSPSRLSAVTATAFTGDRLPSVQSLDSLNRLPRKFSTAPSGVICSTSGPSASVSPSLYLRELTKMNRCCGCVT